MTARRRTTGRRRWTAVVAATALLVAGCGEEHPQSVLSPRGADAAAIDPHWRTMLWLGTAVWVLVAVAVVLAVVRRRRAGEARSDRRVTTMIIVAGAVLPALVVTGLTIQSVGVLRETRADGPEEPLVVEVVAHRYWWEVRYPDHGVTTANELHVPAGERVRLEVTSADVIHSLWAPQLNGKVDLIPGTTNATWIEAADPGTFRGQCAEFCGLQHARMRFRIVAQERDQFDSWLTRQRRPAVDVAARSDALAEGREIFMSSSCVYCHTIRGTAARGDVGPDLTHLASRDTIAAGLLPNTRGHLAGWILDPQGHKPGNRMPGTDLSGPELQLLLDYLESLE